MPLAGWQLSIDQALALGYLVGWRSGDLTTAVAIMTAESGRWTEAWHVNPDASVDRGLFQINSVHLGQGSPPLTVEGCFDPVTNTKFSYGLSAGGDNWSAWAVYKSGAYKQYVAEVRRLKLFHPWRWKKLVTWWATQ